MKKIYLLGLVLMVLFVTTMSAAALEAGSSYPNPGVLPPDSKFGGLTYGEWSENWWQWALEIPVSNNPILDINGAYCAEGQSGNVWFLAGTFGGPEVTRECTVPAEKYILFPIVNTVNLATESKDTEASLRAFIKRFIDKTNLLEVKVDGVSLQELEEYRAYSPAFDVQLPDNNLFGLPSGTYGPAVSDGFWLMLKPLSTGRHEISIHGIVGNGVKKLEVKVIYNLNLV